MSAVIAEGRFIDRVVARAAGRFGCAEGQVYTAAAGMVLSVVLLGAGIPPTLRGGAEPTTAPTAVVGTPVDGAVAGAPIEDGAAVLPGAGVALPFLGASAGAPAPALAPSASSAAASDPAMPFGTATRLASVAAHGEPDGVAVLPSGLIAVAVSAGQAPSKVVVLDERGTVIATHEISGQKAGERHITGLAAVSGGLVVLDASAGRVLVLDPATGHQEVLAALPDLLPCLLPVAATPCQPGTADLPPLPRAVADAGDGSLLVTDTSQGTVWRVTRGAAPVIWHQSADYAPGALQSIAVVAGRAVFTVRATGPTSDDQVMAVAMVTDGSAGARTVVARVAGGAAVAGVVVGRSGRIFVALEALDALLVLDPSGTEVARLKGRDGARVDAPVGLAFVGTSLVVTNRAEPRDVLTVAIDEQQASAGATP